MALADQRPGREVDALANLVGAIGNAQFGSQFFGFLDDRLGIDSCTVFKFGDGPGPSCILADGGSDAHGILRTQIARDVAAEYTAEGYRHCPHLKLLRRVAEFPMVRVFDPHSLASRDYRSRFYVRPNVAHELLVAERVNDAVYYIGIYRGSARGRFSLDNAALANCYAKFFLNCIARHSDLVEATRRSEKTSPIVPVCSDKVCDMVPHLQENLLNTSCGLTRREAQICANIMVGFCAMTIAATLDISVDTVKTHRKRAYSKLGISSQNELFTRYVSATLKVAPRTIHLTN